MTNMNSGFASLQITPDEATALATDAARTQQSIKDNAAAAAKFTHSARVVGDVARVTVRSATDAYGDTTQEVTQEIAPGVTRASAGEMPSSESAPVFHSANGRTLLKSEITPKSLVTLEGVTTDVQSAIYAGLLRQTEDGYVNANGIAAATATNRSDHQQHQPGPQEQPQQGDQAPAVEPLPDQEAEAIMTDAVGKMSHGLATATLTELISTAGRLSPAMTEQLASSLGVSSHEASQRVAKVIGAFQQQAHATLGANHAAILEYAREYQPQALREAMTRQARDGTTAGYKQLAQSFIENLASYNPAALLASPDAQKLGVRQERDGQITIALPQVGRVEWRVAVRSKLISPTV